MKTTALTITQELLCATHLYKSVAHVQYILSIRSAGKAATIYKKKEYTFLMGTSYDCTFSSFLFHSMQWDRSYSFGKTCHKCSSFCVCSNNKMSDDFFFCTISHISTLNTYYLRSPSLSSRLQGIQAIAKQLYT